MLDDVIDDDAIMVSPSQVITFTLCERKWGHEKIGGHREPEKQGAALGTEIHSILEAYCKHGTTPDTKATWNFEGKPKTFYPGKVALNMISRVVPPPGVANTEGEFRFRPGPNEPVVRGFIDLEYEGTRHGFAELNEVLGQCPHGVLVVCDHKSSVDPKKWGKTDETLLVDPQAIMYAMAVLHRWRQRNTGHPPHVLCCWNYGKTNGSVKGCRIVFALFSAKEVFAAFKKLLPTIRRIALLHEERPDPNTLNYNFKACSMYGGCHNRQRCALTTEQKMESLMALNPMLDDLLQDEQTEPATPAPATAEGDAVNPPEATGAGLIDELDALGDAAPANVPAKAKARGGLLADLDAVPDTPAPPKPTPKPAAKKLKAAPAAKPTPAEGYEPYVDIDDLAEKVVERLIARLVANLLG